MANVFRELKVTLEDGLTNGMPQEAKLILLGRVIEALSRDDISNDQALELEEMLGGREQYKEALSYALFGVLVDGES